jgi:PadR family transcriptional regulator PadR
MSSERTDVLYGTLALLILKTLDAMGPLHGYALARRIEQVSKDQIALNQGTLYPALRKLLHKGWITAKAGETDTGRQARFYAITKSGRAQLDAETANWDRATAIVARFVKGLS